MNVFAHLLTVSLAALFASPVPTPVGTGTIEGRLAFPSCFGPPSDVVVCAESHDTIVCTGDLDRSEGDTRYRLEVPAGRYRVFARSLEYRNGFRAYYSRAVTCGLSVDCTDHTPHEVVVRVGAHVRDVDPADWLGSMHAPIPRPLAALPLQPARPIAH